MVCKKAKRRRIVVFACFLTGRVGKGEEIGMEESTLTRLKTETERRLESWPGHVEKSTFKFYLSCTYVVVNT